MPRASRASGPERRGAPVMAFNRVDDKQIKIRSGIYHPDVVVVLDQSLVGLVDVAEGLKPEGILLVNTTKTLADLKKVIHYKGKIATCRRDAGSPGRNSASPSRTRPCWAPCSRLTGVVNLDPWKRPSRSGSAGSPRRTWRP